MLHKQKFSGTLIPEGTPNEESGRSPGLRL
jgi:hypothetical protein